jgi:alpha-ketoglutarate-dependent taurine dioxygenase
LERLRAPLKQLHLIYTHVWKQHDVIFWDNRYVNHSRDTWDGNYLREMHRAQAGGSRPF